MRTENGEIRCNCCKKKIQKSGEISTEEFFHVEKVWGYFSKKDGEKQEFDVCEECYDKWTSSFKIPVQKQEVTEFI